MLDECGCVILLGALGIVAILLAFMLVFMIRGCGKMTKLTESLHEKLQGTLELNLPSENNPDTHTDNE